MSQSSLKEKTAHNLLWGGVSNGVMQIIGVLFGIIFLHLLTPSDYGKTAVLVVFSSVANSLQESGFIAALANRKEPTNEEYNAVFWFNILVGVECYVLLWFLAPAIAEFYHEPVLIPLSRYVFLGLIISALGTVQRAYLFGHLKVKQTGLIGMVSIILSESIGVGMAWAGWAFWGLATQALLYSFFTTLFNWYISPWRPSWRIDFHPIRPLFRFSSKLLLTYLFNLLNSQVFSILLGRFYNTRVVGYYSNARKWCDMASSTINGMISSVEQPTLTQVKEDSLRYQRIFRKMLRFTSFVSFPCMLGIGLIAQEFIFIVAGEKWQESSQLLSLLSIYGAFSPITTLYSNMVISQGKSTINLFCIISLCLAMWVGLILLHPYGVRSMVIFFVCLNLLWLLVWQGFAWKIIQLPFSVLWKDMLPFFILTLFALACAWGISYRVENCYFSLFIKILTAAATYLGLTYLSGARIMRECFSFLLRRRKKKI